MTQLQEDVTGRKNLETWAARLYLRPHGTMENITKRSDQGRERGWQVSGSSLWIRFPDGTVKLCPHKAPLTAWLQTNARFTGRFTGRNPEAQLEAKYQQGHAPSKTRRGETFLASFTF